MGPRSFFDISLTDAIVRIVLLLAVIQLSRVVGVWLGGGLGALYMDHLEPHLGLLDPVVQDDDNRQNDGFLAALEDVALPVPQRNAVAFDGSAWQVVVLIEPDRLRVYEIGDRVIYHEDRIYPVRNDPHPLLEIPLDDGVLPESRLQGQRIHALTSRTRQYRLQIDELDAILGASDSALEKPPDLQDGPQDPTMEAATTLRWLTEERTVNTRMLLAVHPDIPSSTVRQVMYTGGQSGVGQFEFLCRAGEELRVNPSNLPVIGPPDENGKVRLHSL